MIVGRIWNANTTPYCAPPSPARRSSPGSRRRGRRAARTQTPRRPPNTRAVAGCDRPAPGTCLAGVGLEDDEGEQHLQAKPPRDHPPLDRPPIGREQVGKGQDSHESHQRLQADQSFVQWSSLGLPQRPVTRTGIARRVHPAQNQRGVAGGASAMVMLDCQPRRVGEPAGRCSAIPASPSPFCTISPGTAAAGDARRRDRCDRPCARCPRRAGPRRGPPARRRAPRARRTGCARTIDGARPPRQPARIVDDGRVAALRGDHRPQPRRRRARQEGVADALLRVAHPTRRGRRAGPCGPQAATISVGGRPGRAP